MNLAIVIPALNEAEQLPATLDGLRGQEAIVVDGGSRDGTTAIAAHHGAHVLVQTGGRAAQLNAGAAASDAGTLLFLHADTHLPENWAGEVERILSTGKSRVLGAFSLAIRDATPGERIVAAGANIRSRRFGLPYGDQGLFLRRATFDALGGFRALPIMEDYDFVRRARRLGRIVTSPLAVTTSARRWRHRGTFRTTLLNQAMLVGWHAGLSPARLARLYRGT